MTIPIHVAIPVFNNRANIERLIPQLLTQNFDSITVLDDASTDGVANYIDEIPGVECIRSEVNLGTVGANNLQLQSPHNDGILFCIDSDMQLLSDDIPNILRMFLEKYPNTGGGVGKIENSSGERIRWNFDYDINPWRSTLAFCFNNLALWLGSVPLLGSGLRKVATFFSYHFTPDVTQKIDWAIEGFFFVRMDLWRKHGGFDTRFKRYHEGPDLFLWLRQEGYQAWYVPEIVALDTDQGSHSSWYRRYHWFRSTLIYFYKHPSRLLVYKWPRP